MNCFEARQEFPALWRKTVAPERRAELMNHLKGCAKCDHAFRVFAMTAPVLHSDPSTGTRAASVSREFSPSDRPSRFAGLARRESPRRRWLAMSAAAAVLMVGTSAAYLSARLPGETLYDAFSSSESTLNSETTTDLFESELSPTSNDVAS